MMGVSFCFDLRFDLTRSEIKAKIKAVNLTARRWLLIGSVSMTIRSSILCQSSGYLLAAVTSCLLLRGGFPLPGLGPGLVSPR